MSYDWQVALPGYLPTTLRYENRKQTLQQVARGHDGITLAFQSVRNSEARKAFYAAYSHELSQLRALLKIPRNEGATQCLDQAISSNPAKYDETACDQLEFHSYVVRSPVRRRR